MNDIIRSKEDLQKALKEAGLPELPIFEVTKLPELTQEEKRKIQLDAIRDAKNGK